VAERITREMGVVLVQDLRRSELFPLHNLLATMREHYGRLWPDPAEL